MNSSAGSDSDIEYVRVVSFLSQEEEKGPGFSPSHVLRFNHVLISGRVLMMPSESHGRLYETLFFTISNHR